MFLLRHETDGYAKWDASQRLGLECLHQCLKNPLEQDCIPESFIDAFRHILLDNALDMDLRAELLTPPGFEEVIASLHEVDVLAVELVRDKFRHQLGLTLYEQALATYEQLWLMEDHSMNGQAYGRRKLRTICLWLMMKANENEAITLCKKQFSLAKTMSDQIAAFALLVNCSDAASRVQVIESFYSQWARDELVLDKWFAIQATCEHADTLTTVKELMRHPAFSIKNPNKVRALLGAFCQANPRNFHAMDGSGYLFLKNILVSLDKINPQIAARLATPFTRWQRYDAPRKALMMQQLGDLDQLELSRDLREVVTKSLVVETA
jgi:aminopeptidase N